MESSVYKTVSRKAYDEYIINKSRFIGYAAPCETEEQALDFIRSIRERHRDASHNCYAYIIGRNAGIMRYSDDGEPSGTAGMPMIEVLKAQELVNLCIVVTRYFGGVLLGAGGLVRAYSHSAAIAVKAAGVVSMRPSRRIFCDISYPLWDRVEHRLSSMPVILEKINYTQTVEAELLCETINAEQIQKDLISLTDGRIDMLPDEEIFFMPWSVADET